MEKVFVGRLANTCGVRNVWKFLIAAIRAEWACFEVTDSKASRLPQRKIRGTPSEKMNVYVNVNLLKAQIRAHNIFLFFCFCFCFLFVVCVCGGGVGVGVWVCVCGCVCVWCVEWVCVGCGCGGMCVCVCVFFVLFCFLFFCFCFCFVFCSGHGLMMSEEVVKNIWVAGCRLLLKSPQKRGRFNFVWQKLFCFN